ncbi:hypothetical protein GCM10022254_28440 [Actinomadura meridiana]|uniref:Tetratricopeptide repeat protein n=1 Tax=Actinomadura meridiana TaxID=559626 RepID=A0ABP8C1B8_9ACTN
MYLAGFEEILDAVLGRLGRFVDTRDRGDLLAPAGARDAAALVVAARQLAPERAADPPREPWLRAVAAAGLLYHARHLAGGGAEDESEAAGLLESVEQRGGDPAEKLTERLAALHGAAAGSPVPVRADDLDELNKRAVTTPAGTPLAQVDHSAARLRRAMAAAGPDVDLRGYEGSLVRLMEHRYGRTAHEADLREATELSESLVARTPDDQPAYADRILQLAHLRQLAFAETGDAAALDAAVDRLRDAVRHTPGGHDDHGVRLADLGRALKLRYQTTRPEPEEIAEAVATLERAVGAALDGDPLPTRAARLGELSDALALHYRETGDLDHLEAAIRRAHEAWRLVPGDHNIPERLQDLGVVHMLRYRAKGHRSDRRAAIKAARALRRAVPRDHPLYETAEMLLKELSPGSTRP